MDIKDYDVITKASLVSQVCDPFLKQHGLNYFQYTKFHHQQQNLIILDTDPSWVTHVYQQEYIVMAAQVPSGPMFLDSNQINNTVIQDADKHFNHTQCFAYVVNHEDCREIFYLAAPRDAKNMAEFYFSQFDIIQNFFFYFKQKAARLIAQAYLNPILLPDFMVEGIVTSEVADTSAISLDEPSQYIIDGIEQQAALSPKEMQCALRFMRGDSMKEIGKLFHMSPRTVEAYLTRTRQKLNINLNTALNDLLKPYQYLLTS